MFRSSALSSVLSSLLFLAACAGGPQVDSAAPTQVPARFATAERVDIPQRTELAGTVAATQSTAVSSRVTATVIAVPVELGQSVRRGQLLVSIDPATAQGQLGQAQGALAQSKAALTLAERNFERYKALVASGSASELELDMARTQYEQAQGAVRQGEGAVAAAGSVAKESRVVAPFDGRIAAKLVEVGDLAAPGRPLVMLESAAGRRLVVAVPEALTRGAALEPGSMVEVSLDAQPDRGEFAGRVAEVSPGPDPTTHNYTVKIDLPGDAPAGAAGRAYVESGTRAHVLVPAEAVIESGGLDLVAVRGEGNRVETRVVTLGRKQSDGRIEVLSGLAGGESVALGLAVAPPAGAIFTEAAS